MHSWRKEHLRGPQAVGAAIAVAWLAAVTVADALVTSDRVVLTPLFAIAPLIACAVLPARVTAGFVVVAVALAAVAAVWDGAWGDPQLAVQLVDVGLVGGVAVAIAVVRIRREQHLARVEVIAEVAQRAVLPTFPKVAGCVEIGVRYVSAAKDAVVGGDLYDYFHSEAQTRFLVGDVRGKGIAAVEQAARVIRAFRQSAAVRVGLATVATDMNDYLAPFFEDEEFVTALLVDASDPDELALVSCGHPQALLISGGRGLLLDTPAGLPLALGGPYEEMTVPWRPGDRLLMYTDGLSEARDARGEFLPVEDLGPVLSSGSVDAAVDALLRGVRAHVPHGDLGDDLAVVLLENLGAVQEDDAAAGGPRSQGRAGRDPKHPGSGTASFARDDEAASGEVAPGPTVLSGMSCTRR